MQFSSPGCNIGNIQHPLWISQPLSTSSNVCFDSSHSQGIAEYYGPGVKAGSQYDASLALCQLHCDKILKTDWSNATQLMQR